MTYVCKNTCYLVLQTAAAGLDTLRLAAHQVPCRQRLTALGSGFDISALAWPCWLLACI